LALAKFQIVEPFFSFGFLAFLLETWASHIFSPIVFSIGGTLHVSITATTLPPLPGSRCKGFSGLVLLLLGIYLANTRIEAAIFLSYSTLAIGTF